MSEEKSKGNQPRPPRENDGYLAELGRLAARKKWLLDQVSVQNRNLVNRHLTCFVLGVCPHARR